MIKKGIRPQLAEVGKIKTGYKGKTVTSTNGKNFRPPKKLDYFVVTTTERDADGNLIANKDIMERLGEKPRELRIRLPFDSVDKNFFTQYQFYTGAHKVCSGDGETAERLILKSGKQRLPFDDGEKEVNAKEGQRIKIKCDPENCPIYNRESGGCKVSGILSAFLPDADDLGGVYKFRTHSFNSVSSILAALNYFKANTGGILQGLPLKLVMVKKTTNEHGTINYATVVIDGTEIRGLRQLAVEENQSRKLLGTDVQAIEQAAEESGFFTDTDPEDVIDAEFYSVDGDGEPTGAEDVKEALKESEEADTQDGPEVDPSQELF